jgi:FtsP/CotA-like multicopper oxidase with cupredoxin domain
MVQEEATIWFHDHTLGKTHHNVIAGPAGFFPVKEPLKHGNLTAWVPPAAAPASLPAGFEYSWLDPVTEPRGFLGTPMYDLFLAIQDRSFNEDGSINFSNGLGQTIPPPPAILPLGYTPVTNGVNPQVHPTWVPEYFGDHVLVNGVLWPKATVEPGWYRIRVVDGSDSRCWTFGFRVQKPNTAAPAAGTNPTENLPFYVIASDQGYLRNPVLVAKTATMCPGERYELLVNFGQLANGIAAGGAADVYMTNSAPAPFPAGLTPQRAGSPFAEMNVIMKFVVAPTKGPGVKSCGTVGAPAAVTTNGAAAWDKFGTGNLLTAGGRYTNICMPANPALVTDPGFRDIRPPLPFAAGTIVRQVYLNEKVDPVTLAPLGMQLNGVPFEYKVTETPKLGSREVWQFVNLTVDAHPMHPHLVQHQLVSRQTFNVGAYKKLLCGATTCMPGPSPGGEMLVVPDVTPLLTGTPVVATAVSVEGGFKDAIQVPPGQVTTIVADWTPRWVTSANDPRCPAAGCAAAPGVAGSPANAAAPYFYDPVTSGPYVWHCHINSHEDSEMMRTSLVVP